jgi:hypothetical protein
MSMRMLIISEVMYVLLLSGSRVVDVNVHIYSLLLTLFRFPILV